ncbi:flagellar biosynthesis protein FlgA [Amycolatopsis sp. RTGN1]|uniref:flagellar biosynthesis protein FlgA n=1 Tax=Amycolatopsis ponsaeliensis TaxID=2992142 RepID=UPI00254E3843|nr:flagellar biosynthesis protein FlgA [Amycolatopsis sp. RTGN1]
MTTRGPLRTVPDAPPSEPMQLRPPRRRRSKLLILLGLLLSAVSATGVVWVFRAVDDSIAAVGVASPVRYGDVITADVLLEVHVRPDPGVHALAWDQRFEIIGKPASTDLRPGAIVTPDLAAGSTSIPAPGEQLVGVAVKPGQLPTTPLEPRQPVLLVPVGSTDTAWTPVHGSVLRVGARDSSSLQVVDIVVLERDGAQVASRASAGGVAIVALPKGG